MFAVAESPPCGPNSDGCWLTARPRPGWREAFDGGSRIVRDGVLHRRRRRHVVENPVTRIALDDAVVLAHLLEHLWAQPHVAHGTEAVARGAADGNALPELRKLIEEVEQPGLEPGDDRSARVGGAGERSLDCREFLRQLLLLGFDFLFP